MMLTVTISSSVRMLNIRGAFSLLHDHLHSGLQCTAARLYRSASLTKPMLWSCVPVLPNLYIFARYWMLPRSGVDLRISHCGGAGNSIDQRLFIVKA